MLAADSFWLLNWIYYAMRAYIVNCSHKSQDWSDSIKMTISIEPCAVHRCAERWWRFPLIALLWPRRLWQTSRHKRQYPLEGMKYCWNQARHAAMNWSAQRECGDKRHGGIAITCSAWQDKCFANNKLFYSQFSRWKSSSLASKLQTVDALYRPTRAILLYFEMAPTKRHKNESLEMRHRFAFFGSIARWWFSSENCDY